MSAAEISSYAVVDLVSWAEQGSLRISPKFQRRAVWNTAARGYFIESLLLGYPIPPVHIRLTRSGRDTVREVVDGQQRIRAVFDFIAGRYRIPPSVSDTWGGQYFAGLTDDEQDRIRLFSFTVYQYKYLTDAEVLEIFARLNTHSVRLNKQELRNGKWFGRFKQLNYKVASDSLGFWQDHKVFTDQQVARMREVEFVAELLIVQMDGLQDKKISIDVFYSNLDEMWSSEPVVWPQGKDGETRRQPADYLSESESHDRFRAVLSDIADVFGEQLATSPLRRAPLFYTLYSAVYHARYGLPRFEKAPLAASGFTDPVRAAMGRVIVELSEAFDSKGQTRDQSLRQFYEASTQQTDNLQPREARLRALIEATNARL